MLDAAARSVTHLYLALPAAEKAAVDAGDEKECTIVAIRRCDRWALTALRRSDLWYMAFDAVEDDPSVQAQSQGQSRKEMSEREKLN
jgi:hypothetical protein